MRPDCLFTLAMTRVGKGPGVLRLHREIGMDWLGRADLGIRDHRREGCAGTRTSLTRGG